MKAVDAVFIGAKMDRQEASRKMSQGRPAFLSDEDFARIVNGAQNVDDAVANLASRFALEGKNEPVQGYKSYLLARASRLRTQFKNGEGELSVKEFQRGRPRSAAVIQRQMAELQAKLERVCEPLPEMASVPPSPVSPREEAKLLMLEKS